MTTDSDLDFVWTQLILWLYKDHMAHVNSPVTGHSIFPQSPLARETQWDAAMSLLQVQKMHEDWMVELP